MKIKIDHINVLSANNINLKTIMMQTSMTVENNMPHKTSKPLWQTKTARVIKLLYYALFNIRKRNKNQTFPHKCSIMVKYFRYTVYCYSISHTPSYEEKVNFHH